ncbi:MAG: enolase C-terminal domain-like protein, partial [Flavobacteriales bacterium]|nr:enolase C-terminal domain-like protein [Flavobacteriales bacterium]
AAKLGELPRSRVLKVKLGSGLDRRTMEQVLALDDRRLFLDANQGWTDVRQALDMVRMAGEGRLVGIEQPFAADRWDLHRQLGELTDVPVYADESVQGPDDLERAAGSFGGVNIKLMKCGGPDVAVAMARRARALGMRVMLGSMSESSLGSAVMAQLSGLADLADLDGPWLVRNDPFQGLAIADGRMTVTGRTGAGVQPRPGLLDWIQLGA